MGILIVLILYLVYTYIFRDSTSSNLYRGGNAKQAQVIDPKKLPGNKGSVDFTFSPVRPLLTESHVPPQELRKKAIINKKLRIIHIIYMLYCG